MDSLKDVLRAQLDKAVKASARADDHSVHEARKELKRARATLRLMRDAIGDVQYRSANHRLRDAARPLRPARDAAALLKTLGKVAADRDRDSTKGLTERWQQQRRQAHGPARVADRIRQVERRVLALPMLQTDALSARRGIKQSYRRGRRAFAMACLDPSDFLLHEWRKQAKYLANELELSRDLLQLGLKKTRRRAAKLASTLGDDHDLASLSVSLREAPAAATATGPLRGLKTFRQRIERKRQKLQAKAYRRGAKLYARPVRKFGALLKYELH